ncbi:MAG: metal ABC transporter permease [Trueperaceae bacterium]|nr:MAG: metal ABC transporter permease [Trueperaceae bacterium]
MILELLDIVQYPFMRRALLAGILIAVMCGLLGVFVVQRRLSFLGDGLAHAAFGGMGLGTLLLLSGGWLGAEAALFRQPLFVALPFVFITALSIAWVRDNTNLSSDTTIGVFFAVAVALGVMFFSLIPPDASVNFDVMDLLFGSILGVRQSDLVIISATLMLCLIVIIPLWGRLGYATFDEELARTDGVATRRLEYLLFGTAAVVIAVSSLVVGIILMAAYLVIPAASARLLAKSLFQMTAFSVMIGVSSTVVGLLAAVFLDVPSGSTIVLSQAVLFACTTLLARRRIFGSRS